MLQNTYTLNKFFLLFMFLLTTSCAFSQGNFFRLGFGVEGGVTTAYTGFEYNKDSVDNKLWVNKSRSFGASIDYFFSPFLSAGLEYNQVELKDGPDQYQRSFVSKFSSTEMRFKLSAGQFMKFHHNEFVYALRYLNVGLGLGLISGTNNVGDFGSDQNPRRLDENDIGKSEYSSVLSFPASVGYSWVFHNAFDEPFIQVGLNYKVVFTTSDDIDGYNLSPLTSANKAKDIYTTLGASVKVLFGPRKLYK